MYKDKIQKWGLNKKLKEDDLLQILHISEAAGARHEKGIFYVRGRQLSAERIGRSINRNPKVVERFHAGVMPCDDSVKAVIWQSVPWPEVPGPGTWAEQGEECNSVSQAGQSLAAEDWSIVAHVCPPLPTNLKPPDTLYDRERALGCVVTYTNDCFHRKLDVNSDLYGHEHLVAFCADMKMVALRLNLCRDSAVSFALLDQCCEDYQHILKAEDLGLVSGTYTAIMTLSYVSEDAAMMFMRYAMASCKIRFGSAHPLTNFWESVHDMGLQEARQACFHILNTQFDCMHRAAGPSPTLFVTTLLLHRSLHAAGLLKPHADISTLAKETIDRMNSFSKLDSADGEFWQSWARTFMASMVGNGTTEPNRTQPVVEDAALRSLEKWYREKCPDRKANIVLMACIGATEELWGKYEVAENYYKAAVEVALHQVPRDHLCISRAHFTLEKYYRRRGNIEEVEQTSRTWTKC